MSYATTNPLSLRLYDTGCENKLEDDTERNEDKTAIKELHVEVVLKVLELSGQVAKLKFYH